MLVHVIGKTYYNYIKYFVINKLCLNMLNNKKMRIKVMEFKKHTLKQEGHKGPGPIITWTSYSAKHNHISNVLVKGHPKIKYLKPFQAV